MLRLKTMCLLVAIGFAQPAKASSCDTVYLQSKSVLDLFTEKKSELLAALYRRSHQYLAKMLQLELARQQVLSEVLQGRMPAEPLVPWQLDEARYVCSRDGDTVPRPCVYSDADVAARQAAEQLIAINTQVLTGLLAELSTCNTASTAQEGPGFGLLDENEVRARTSGEVSAAELAEPAEARGQIFWSSWTLEQSPELTQSVRDSLVAVWQEQVRSLFREFNALNFELGQNLHSDAKMVQEGELTVIYRNGQKVVAFYRPEGVYLKVFVEVPFFFRNKLGGAAAVSLVLKRTTKGNFSVHEYQQVPSINIAGDAALLERTFFQLEAMDVKAKEYLDSVATVTKGLEAGPFAKARTRLTRALWLPMRILGGVTGFFLGTTVFVPMLRGTIEPSFLALLPSLATLWGGMLMSKLGFDERVAEILATLMNKEFKETRAILTQMVGKKDQLLEFRAKVELMRQMARAGGPCNAVLQQKMQTLLTQWQTINKL